MLAGNLSRSNSIAAADKRRASPVMWLTYGVSAHRPFSIEEVHLASGIQAPGCRELSSPSVIGALLYLFIQRQMAINTATTTTALAA